MVLGRNRTTRANPGYATASPKRSLLGGSFFANRRGLAQHGKQVFGGLEVGRLKSLAEPCVDRLQ
jgi:hypothetical protein